MSPEPEHFQHTARPVSVAAIQMACDWNTGSNIATAERLVREAAARGAQIILLPELFETPYFCIEQDARHLKLAHSVEENRAVRHFREVARELGVVLPISFFERAGPAYFNSVALIDADGANLGVYRKSHIPNGPGYQEKSYFSPGDTGFKVFDSGNMPAFAMRGVGGVSLERWWDANRLQAYEGVSVPGFPNSFSILGPYGFNGQSYFGLIETQMRHIVRCLKRARREGATRVEITPEANRRYFEKVLARRGNQVFFQGSCANANSYYFDKHGDVPFRPSLTLEAAWRSARFDLDDYAFAA